MTQDTRSSFTISVSIHVYLVLGDTIEGESKLWKGFDMLLLVRSVQYLCGSFVDMEKSLSCT